MNSQVNDLPSVALTAKFLVLCEQYGAERLVVRIVAAGRSAGVPGLPHETLATGATARGRTWCHCGAVGPPDPVVTPSVTCLADLSSARPRSFG
jgi:hypothetical protein